MTNASCGPKKRQTCLPTKLTLGTMLFTVPPLLVILIGPSIHGIATMLAAVQAGRLETGRMAPACSGVFCRCCLLAACQLRAASVPCQRNAPYGVDAARRGGRRPDRRPPPDGGGRIRTCAEGLSPRRRRRRASTSTCCRPSARPTCSWAVLARPNRSCAARWRLTRPSCPP